LSNLLLKAGAAMRLLSALSSEILKTSKNGDSTTSLGNQLYYLTVLMGKKFLITLDLKLSFVSLCPLPLILLPSTTIKSQVLVPIDLPIGTGGCC